MTFLIGSTIVYSLLLEEEVLNEPKHFLHTPIASKVAPGAIAQSLIPPIQGSSCC
jgi:hypothetical protein